MVVIDCWNFVDLPPNLHQRHLDVGPTFDDDVTVIPHDCYFGDSLIRNHDDWVDVVAVDVASPRIDWQPSPDLLSANTDDDLQRRVTVHLDLNYGLFPNRCQLLSVDVCLFVPHVFAYVWTDTFPGCTICHSTDICEFLNASIPYALVCAPTETARRRNTCSTNYTCKAYQSDDIGNVIVNLTIVRMLFGSQGVDICRAYRR